MAIDKSAILLSIVVPRDYARHLLAGQEADVQLLVDGSDSNTASIALGYAQAVIQSYAAQLRSDAQVQRGGQPLRVPVDPRIRVWYNSDLKSKNFIVPGLIAVTMMIIASMLSSLTIAREWENGTMEQLLSTPVRPRELVLGKLLAYFALGVTDMLICIIVGVFIFQVPFRGSVWFLFFSSCLFLFGALRWGIFISATARTQMLAFQMGMLSSFLPGYLLSGFIYSIHEHAEGDSGDQLHRARALFRHHPERRVSEGRGHPDAVAAKSACWPSMRAWFSGLRREK